jgi:O-antigen ligase
MPPLHQVVLAVLLVGNAVAFAGVDPPTRFASAILVLVLMVDMRTTPPVPGPMRWAAVGLGALVFAQLVPLPLSLRRVLQPGFGEVMAAGWSSLSLAPWATFELGASAVLACGLALAAARMSASRSGLPLLLGTIAVTCGVIGLLGLAGESGAPDKVLLVRDNTGGGDPYGPFVNSNHFAAAVELSLPAALVLAAAAARNLSRPGEARQRAAVATLGAVVVAVIATAAVVRSSSRGGVVFLAFGLLASVPLWLRKRPGRRWPWLVGLVGLAVVVGALAWTRVPALREGFEDLLLVEGIEGNTRWDLWAGTLDSFARSPLLGSGSGSYAYVIGLDKPATGIAILEQAHNDWLEWLSTTGLAGAALLALFLAPLVVALRPRRVRRLRYDLRYPLAGAAAALVATALHEMVGFGLQTPLNLYLCACWVGLVLGIDNRLTASRTRGEGAKEATHRFAATAAAADRAASAAKEVEP